jgi:hypothetical protein
MDTNTREWAAMKNCAVSWASEKYQVSGFQVSGVCAKPSCYFPVRHSPEPAGGEPVEPVERGEGGSLDTCHFGLATAAFSARNDGQQSFSAASKHRHNLPSVYSVTSVFKI